MSVTTVYLPGDEPAAQLQLPMAVEVRPADASSKAPARKPRKGPAWVAAYTAMSSIAERMRPNTGPALRHADPVAYANLVTSMCDQRAALCLAMGVPVEHIDRDGYNISRTGPRRLGGVGRG